MGETDVRDTTLKDPAYAEHGLSRVAGLAQSLFRIVVGFLFTIHGIASLFGIVGGGAGTPLRFAVWPGWWAAAIQFVAGGLVLLGLFIRPAAILCAGSMAYAYFTVHAPRSLWPVANGGETAALFCWSFLIIAVVGGGAWSLDAVLARRPTDHSGHQSR